MLVAKEFPRGPGGSLFLHGGNPEIHEKFGQSKRQRRRSFSLEVNAGAGMTDVAKCRPPLGL